MPASIVLPDSSSFLPVLQPLRIPFHLSLLVGNHCSYQVISMCNSGKGEDMRVGVGVWPWIRVGG